MTYRRDRNINSGNIILLIRDGISPTLLNTEKSIKVLHIEINVRKKKWRIGCSYDPHKTFMLAHLKEIDKNLGICSSSYEKYILLGDLNSEPKEQSLIDFCRFYNSKNIIKENTCFKKPANPSCIDLFITNMPEWFQDSMTIETRLSDFHKISLSIMINEIDFMNWTLFYIGF